MSQDSVFEVRNVTCRYESVAALEGISLSIERGKRIALLGANGSGKSTLLRLLNALHFPDSGSVAFNGQPLAQEAFDDDAFAFDFRSRVGLVFQSPEVQLFNPTVFDEVAFAPLHLGWPKERIRAAAAEILEEMEITHLRDRPPHRLSGGEKKRVALASVLVMNPEVLLLDEPTAGLDPRSESQMIDMLMSWGGETRTVITTTHDLGLVEDIADYCFVLQSGRVAAKGPPAEVLRDVTLLERANLIHAHRHRHASGVMHSHPHTHPHRHD